MGTKCAHLLTTSSFSRVKQTSFNTGASQEKQKKLTESFNFKLGSIDDVH